MKKFLTAVLGAVMVAQVNLVSAVIDFEGSNTVDEGLKGSGNDAVTEVELIVTRLVGFLYLLAVFYALWGGFNILTAGGDEEKVKKGKTILIQAGIGLVVIFLANSIIFWILNSVLGLAA